MNFSMRYCTLNYFLFNQKSTFLCTLISFRPYDYNIITHLHMCSEFQQVVMGLKREHRDNLNRLTKSQELALFSLRGEQAERFTEAEERCVRLEAQVKALQQEVERYKTLADIQVSYYIWRAVNCSNKLFFNR